MKNVAQLTIASLILALIGCGSSGGTTAPTNDPSPITDVDPDKTEPTDKDNTTTDPVIDCNAPVAYDIAEATDEGLFDESFTPSLAIDGNTSGDSKWSSEGQNRWLQLDLGESKLINSVQIQWFKGDERQSTFSIEASDDATNWQSVLTKTSSSGTQASFESYNITATTARYLKLTGYGNTLNDWNSIVEFHVHACENAGTPLLPNELGIDLADWYLSIPTDDDNSGTSDSISETELMNGYSNSDFFYVSSDKGLVFKSPSQGFKTSTNTKYVRSELREMLRRGNTSHKTQGVNKNNWVFSTAPSADLNNAGGIDGELFATVAVNHVTTTGEDYQIGRVIIGQIHANDDEPIRLYYRKLPSNSKGAIYFAHEPIGKNDEYIEIIGSRTNSASNPSDGIALNEKFSYKIQVVGHELTVTIIREGKPDVVRQHDMSNSGYDVGGQYMYFKAGVYNQNNSSDANDYVQATFYALKNSHTGYAESE
ncbi:polysaccharide lyase family 7 protein [Algibacillus agarilyticus]|uniref:polysaccharide lyase family 7 protein n=1 Tax=Algibacillus agarilyticus TaxID=2234133 RepID=UPI000DCF6E7B|nr:polysaccharide lyase family 7 protein [Algibacillus agarilyticus]